MAKAKKNIAKKVEAVKKKYYTPRKVIETKRTTDSYLAKKLDNIYITLKEQNSVLCELNNRLVYHDETFPNCISQWMSFIDKSHTQAKRSYEANEKLLEDIKQVYKKISLIVSAPIERICAPTIDAQPDDMIEALRYSVSKESVIEGEVCPGCSADAYEEMEESKVDKLFEEHKSEEKRSRGRPTVIDPDKKEAALELSNKGVPVLTICEKLGLSMATVYRFVNKDKRQKRKP